jgi:hypothetical protein
MKSSIMYMEKSLTNIKSLYKKYDGNTISRLEMYINIELPVLLDKYNKQEKKNLFLETKIKKYIKDFITNNQFFYIKQTDTFLKYDGENYIFVNEDAIWFIILKDILNYEILIESKQNIKSRIIKNIKERSLFNTIPESYTVQFVLSFFTPTLFDTKDDVKHFMTLIGDNILNKSSDLYYFVPIESKLFFDTLEAMVYYHFGSRLNITSLIRYRYRGEDYDKSRIIYFTKSISNKSCWLSFLKDNIFNFLAVCCHYSARYVSAVNYVNKGNAVLKSKILYLKNNTKEELIHTFSEKMLIKGGNHKIHLKDMFFLWKIYLKQRNIPNIIYKLEFETIIKNKVDNSNNFFTSIKSNYLAGAKFLKKFWITHMLKDNDEEIEISELHTLLMKWLEDKPNFDFDENSLRDIIDYFYDDVTIENDKFLIGIGCNLWNKQADILEAFQNKFNKEINADITIYDSYVMYCKYSGNNGKLLTVSKKYYYKYIDKVIPTQYINEGCILLSYFENL